MHLISMFFWNALAVMILFAAALFFIYTLVAGFTLFCAITDKTLSLKDRMMLVLLMAITVAWGGWLAYFSRNLGLSLLTF